MRIISKFHEYYDCIQREGQDRTCIYLRDINKRQEKIDFPELTQRWSRYNTRHHKYTYYVGFCGKIYPIINITYWSPYREFICHSSEEVHQAVYLGNNRRYIKEYDTDSLQKLYRNIGFVFNKKGVEQFFSLFPITQEKLFIESGCPVFIAGENDIHEKYKCNKRRINYYGKLKDTTQSEILIKQYLHEIPTLTGLNFQRIFDPYRTFQEIHMYLSGVLGTGNPTIPEVPDKIMVEAKGFDKWSFRKQK